MSSYSIAIRIKEGSDLDRVYKSWVKANNWTQSEFLEHAIREIAGIEPVYKDSMEQGTLQRLTDIVTHLVTITSRLEQGGVLSADEGAQVRKTMEQAVPDEVRSVLVKMKRPAIKG